MNPEPELPAPAAAKTTHRESVAGWKAAVADFQRPSFWRASWQIVNTIGGYALLWVLMYFSLSVSWWLTIPLAVLSSGFLIRSFIIFHDCGHGSFFKSNRANNFWGFVTGVLCFTPYYHWRWEHSLHHASSGDLDRRGFGDVWTLTVEEYLNASRWKKLSYRLVRTPIVLFVIAPVILFVVVERFYRSRAKMRERLSVWLTNLAVIALALGLIWIFGFWPWLIIQLTATAVSCSAGVWLFYVQHQYEDTYWENGEEWDYTAAAMEGSSFYKLPRLLQWFSGNIGFHHIHHLSPRIPNYHLERCHLSDPMFFDIKPLTFFVSLKAVSYRLWDEQSRKLISFRGLKIAQASRAAAATTVDR
ncbi:MAG: fatty acid desaturase [Akkermansiaceae bacterium]|nr:fatty acid desaturase [Akkermansiaceae bacterium]